MKKLVVIVMLIITGLIVFVYVIFASPVSIQSRPVKHEMALESASELLNHARDRLGFSRYFLTLTSACIVSEQVEDERVIHTIGFMFTRTLIPTELYQVTYVCCSNEEELVISMRDEPKEITNALGIPVVHSQPLDGAGLKQFFENPQFGERWLKECHPDGYQILEIFQEAGDIQHSVMNKRVDLTLGQVLPELKRLYD